MATIDRKTIVIEILMILTLGPWLGCSAGSVENRDGSTLDADPSRSTSMSDLAMSALSDGGASPDEGTVVPATGLSQVRSLVILGDSISSGGGEAPFYFDLLRQALSAHYGPVQYDNNAQGGSTTMALVAQIGELPHDLPGPVAVVITSGANNLQAALPSAIAGTDSAARVAMSNDLAEAIQALRSPGRFGAGVPAYVFVGNIYDSSDGVGDFGNHGCPGTQGTPTIPTATIVSNWNGAIAAPVAAAAQRLVDIHAAFAGHGYAGTPSWYMTDCSHPNALGHAALDHLFYEAITGSPLP